VDYKCGALVIKLIQYIYRMKKGLFLIFSCFTLGNSVTAQSIQFNKAFPVAPDSNSWSFSIQKVPSGYIIYGITVDSNYHQDPAIVKIDTEGTNLWQSSYNRPGYDFYPLGTANELGIVVPWGGEIGAVDWINDTTSSFPYWSLYRFDDNGDTIWTRNYQDSTNTSLDQVKISREKKYVIYGEWNNSSDPNFTFTTLLLIKTDSLGNKIWTKTYHDTNSHVRISSGMDTCRDGGYILCAYDYDTIPNYAKVGCLNGQIMVMKTDSSGDIQWLKYITDTLCDVEGSSIIALKNGGYVVCGFWDDSLNWSGEIPYCIMYMAKLNDSGNMVWSNRYGVHNNFEGSVSLSNLKELPNGDLIVCGYGNPSGVPGAILRTDSNGNQKWLQYYYKFYPRDDDLLTDIQLTNDGGFISSGWTYSNPPYIWVVKTDSLGCDSGCNDEVTAINKVINNSSGLMVYPNPNNGLFTLSLSNVNQKSAGGRTSCNIEIYNVLGEKVYSQFTTDNSQFTIDLNGQPNGIYLYRVLAETGELAGEGKIVMEK